MDAKGHSGSVHVVPVDSLNSRLNSPPLGASSTIGWRRAAQAGAERATCAASLLVRL